MIPSFVVSWFMTLARLSNVYSKFAGEGALFAHAVGYDYLRTSRAGLERQYNDELTGKRTELETMRALARFIVAQ